MVGIYRNLFFLLIVVTAAGIGIAFLHIPVWIAVGVALAIIMVKAALVWGAFKHLLAGKQVLFITFGLTAIFFAGLLILPFINSQDHLVGTEDLSRQIQMETHPAAAGAGHGTKTEGEPGHGH